MASNYPAQTYTIPTTNKAGHTYGPNRNPSPASSTSPATSPHNISPTSPRFHNYMHPPPNPHKQLREQRKPLYVPAVLRPTEFPKASGSVTPPKSVHGSLDSLDSRAELDQAIDGRDQWPFEGIGGDGIDEEELGEVTGPPGREHWKPDEASPTCDSARCRLSFNLLTRRHHCRHCGHIFCASHTSYSIPLNQDAKFHPEGIMSKACDSCYRQYQRWDGARTARNRRRKGSEDDETDLAMEGPGSPGRRIVSGLTGGLPHGRANAAESQVANSVPKDWAWSTF